MPTGLTSQEVAGVLDQLYRAASDGGPRRFNLPGADLKRLAGRKRGRVEFFEDVGGELEIIHSILMSYPRFGRGEVLGFASLRVAEGWPPAPEWIFRDALHWSSDTDWALSARKCLQNLQTLSQDNRELAQPISITEGQLCRLVNKRKFEQRWWQELLGNADNVPSNERLIFFKYDGIRGNTFAITHENYVGGWKRYFENDWVAALKRYHLEEFDEEADPKGK